MLRVIQVLVFSSPRWNWESIRKNGFSFLRISTRSSSNSSSRAAARMLCPVVSTRGSECFRSSQLSAIRSESRPDELSSPSSSSSSKGLDLKQAISFCQWCGAATKQAIPDGDDKIRTICTNCSKVSYQNPKIVVGCLVEHDDKILLCRRKIQPAYGLWTLPAGYLEIGESAVEGATRETLEEACADVEVVAPFSHLDIPLIGQTYIIFQARLKKPQFSPGPESLDCQLFSLDDIPFESLAFSSMLVTLKLYIEDLKTGKPKFHYGTIKKRAGTGPSDISEYTFVNHLQC